jgi:hypothetical protein
VAGEARIAWLNRAKEILAKVNLAALKHSMGVGPLNGLDKIYLNIRVALRESVQETGHRAFNELWGGRHLQRTRIAAP